MDILYHYCSTKEYYSIIQNRKIWLSSLELSNDTKEGKLVREVIVDLARENNRNEEEVEILISAIEFTENMFEGVGFCMSINDDQLSQWRGYASDGKGVAVGFSVDELKLMVKNYKQNKLYLGEVQYNNQDQKKLLMPIYTRMEMYFEDNSLKNLIRQSDVNKDRSKEQIDADYKKKSDKLIELLNFNINDILPILFFLKLDAFDEEKEWRLVGKFFKDPIEIVDEYLLRVNDRDVIVPYCAIDISNKSIVDIVLGPKHQTPERVHKSFLKKNGFTAVLRKSKATYQ